MDKEQALFLGKLNNESRTDSKEKTYLKLHQQQSYQGTTYACSQCEHKANSKEIIKKHMESHQDNIPERSQHEDNNRTSKSTYVSKRIKCNKCEKKFNKNETFEKHLKKFHGGAKISETNQNEQTK